MAGHGGNTMRTSGRIGRAAGLATLGLAGLALTASPAAAAGVIDLTALDNLSDTDAETLLVEELRRLQG